MELPSNRTHSDPKTTPVFQTHKKEGNTPFRFRLFYKDLPNPIVFFPVVVNTLGRLYDDFLRFRFLDTHR
jgi:hypothetical protein